MPRHVLARFTLLFGVLALGLAVIPGVAYDEPFPWQRKEHAKAAAANAKVKDLAAGGELKVKVSNLEFSLGRKNRGATTAPAVQEPAPPVVPADPTKTYR